jgi:hypothetical protein
VVVIDAKTMSPDPVAVIELPGRVPIGFHGMFVREVSEDADICAKFLQAPTFYQELVAS